MVNDLDLNDHHDLFHEIYSQVKGTPNENSFLRILRHLLMLDTSNKMTSIIWDLIEKLICKVTVLDRDELTIVGTMERYTQEKFKEIFCETKKQNLKGVEQINTTEES